ncbi:MAG TPA: TetR/AcrR family transcriptional regulator [Burkholderiaceae bacterium]|nr:TetR/AcrR family transcriptional regulator [Burkholderiaceae bacterium]
MTSVLDEVPGPLASALPSPDPALRTARLGRGGQTRSAIVEHALALARREGLEGLTIGSLAAELGMSKSGVFAHFGSREELQLAVLREYAARFVDEVLRPAVRAPRGLPRLRAMVENWVKLLARELEQGCLMIGGASEYDDRPGPLRDAMVSIITGWNEELERAAEQAKEEGQFRADVDTRQLVFEIYGTMLALHQAARLLRANDSLKLARASVARLLADAAAPGAARSRKVSRAASTKESKRSAARSVAKSAARRRTASRRTPSSR